MKYIAKKGFNDPNGYQRRDTEWTGCERRAKELLVLGLIEPAAEEKAAPKAENKMRQEFENKSEPSSPSPGEAASTGPADNPDAAKEVSASSAGTALVAQNAADVVAAVVQVADADVLAAGLEAEQAKGEKARKSVIEALTSAMASIAAAQPQA